MFLKPLRRKMNGKQHVYGALVESFRAARGPRHRVVPYLGELSPGERRGRARLGAALNGNAESKARQLSILGPESASERVPETLEVRLAGVQVKRTRDFGEVFLVLSVWRMLGLDGDFADKDYLIHVGPANAGT